MDFQARKMLKFNRLQTAFRACHAGGREFEPRPHRLESR